MVRRSQRREERGKGRWGHAMPGHVLTQRTAAVHANSLTARERTNLELGGGLVKPLLKFPNAPGPGAPLLPQGRLEPVRWRAPGRCASSKREVDDAARRAGGGAPPPNEKVDDAGALAASAPPPNEKVDDAGALAAGAPPPNEKADDAGALAAGAPPPNEKLGAAVPKPPPLPPEGATRATDANGLALGAEAAESPSVAPPPPSAARPPALGVGRFALRILRCASTDSSACCHVPTGASPTLSSLYSSLLICTPAWRFDIDLYALRMCVSRPVARASRLRHVRHTAHSDVPCACWA